MTGWLRNYIAYYAVIAKPLQDRKIAILASSLKSGDERRNFARKNYLSEPTPVEKTAFKSLQRALSILLFLTYFDKKRVLYINLDASKEFGFGAIVYHIKGQVQAEAYPTRSQLQPILFLSRLLKDAETRY